MTNEHPKRHNLYQADRHTDASLFDNKILVVDDASLNRELISSYLKSAGYRYIQTAVDGQDALEKVGEFEPNLVILDLIMPNIDGTQVIKTLRSDIKTKQLPILVQTSVSDPEQRNEAWKNGATDVITKPTQKTELLARVKVQLENSFLIQELENYQKIADLEFAKALELQNSLLPSKEQVKRVEEKYGMNIDSLYYPSRFLSGDMWGMHEIQDHNLLLWICDFSGKGIRASLNTLQIHTLISEFKGDIQDPLDLLNKLNSRLVDMVQVGNFCTFMVGVIDTHAHRFDYVSASSTHPIIYHPSQKSYTLGDGSGMPLGITKESNYISRHLPFNSGDSLILYSDLMWEDQGGVPGISLIPEGLPSFFQELGGRGVVEVVKEQCELVGETNFSDDLTVVEVHLK